MTIATNGSYALRKGSIDVEEAKFVYIGALRVKRAFGKERVFNFPTHFASTIGREIKYFT